MLACLFLEKSLAMVTPGLIVANLLGFRSTYERDSWHICEGLSREEQFREDPSLWVAPFKWGDWME